MKVSEYGVIIGNGKRRIPVMSSLAGLLTAALFTGTSRVRQDEFLKFRIVLEKISEDI
jgi:hypothetical protein